MTTHATTVTELLKKMIATPSFSRDEKAVATLLREFFAEHGIATNTSGNNTWAYGRHIQPSKPTLLLNSHCDTVKPNAGWTKDPFTPVVEDGKLYGLGSNDAGGALCSLVGAFLHFHDQEHLPFNLAIALTAEEEISGEGGIVSVLPYIGKIDSAIVGEPTLMKMAVAEKGLLVLDCVAYGKAGHAAREEGENAIYKAMKDIEWFRTYRFPKKSQWLGEMKMSVTIIEAGTQHNVVPALCKFTVDVRVTDAYSHDEVLSIIRENVSCEVVPHSLRLNPSGIPNDHPLVKAANACGIDCYGSPTLSDQALIPVPSVKFGPGDSARSHTADEYIGLNEITEGVDGYIRLIEAYGKELNEIYSA